MKRADKRADKANRKAKLKLVRRVKGRGLTPIPAARIEKNRKQEIIEKLINKETNET